MLGVQICCFLAIFPKISPTYSARSFSTSIPYKECVANSVANFQIMKVLTAIYLDKRREKSDKTYPLKLRVSFQKERRYFGIGIDITEDDWQKVNSTSSNSDLKKIRAKTIQIVDKVNTMIKDMGEFSFHKFEALYLCKEVRNLQVREAFIRYIYILSKEGRASTAESYTNASCSLMDFKPALQFTEITPSFLHDYENWMLNRKRTLSTIGMYLRALRCVINIAIDEGVMKRDQYPFGKRKYQIPMGQNIKKSLSKEEVAALYYYDTFVRSPKDKARDFWLFSYLANGMNFKDICRLKFSNICNDTIVFNRAKTVHTRRSNPIQIVAVITEDMQRIMDKWGNPIKEFDNYIFPILPFNVNPQRERELVKQFIKVTNKWLQRIAGDVGIQKKITTYAARHSFSTILKNEGASIQYIKESLGHNSTQTTENYLNAFPDSMKRKFAEQLTTFKNVV
jgi:integrase/recombinase XerD